MKLLIEEEVLRQALEAFEYDSLGHTVIITALRETLDAAEKVEPVAWMITTDNTNLHPLDPNKEGNWLAFDVNQFRNDSARALVISDTQPLYLHPALDAAERDELKQWLEDQVCEAKDFAYKLESKTVELATATKERDELAALNARMLVEYEARMKERNELRDALYALAKVGADN